MKVEFGLNRRCRCTVDSPYRDAISMAILRLQEGGQLQMLYNKWWGIHRSFPRHGLV